MQSIQSPFESSRLTGGADSRKHSRIETGSVSQGSSRGVVLANNINLAVQQSMLSRQGAAKPK